MTRAYSRAMRWCVPAVAAIAIALVTAAPARADDQLGPPQYTRDALIVVLGGGAYAIGELPAKDGLSPSSCRWCADNAFDRGVRDALVWDDRDAANTVSNVTAFGAAPALSVAALGLTGGSRDLLHNTLILAEAGVISADVAYLVKIVVARERPFVHQLADADKPHTARPVENNLSFYSGHSTLAMSLAVAAGTTATLRGYRRAPLVWATLVPLAVATGYFRIGADKHWATDVTVGWITGAAFGFAVPYFLHRGAPPVTPTVSRTSTTTTVGVAAVW